MRNSFQRVNFGVTVWFSGYPSSGKSTIASCLAQLLDQESIPVIMLDGDEMRPIIGADIGYSAEDRGRILVRYIDLCQVLIRTKAITLVVVNNHSQQQRDKARHAFSAPQFLEVWVNTDLSVCMERDVKGLYREARSGKRTNVVGVDISYEDPTTFDVRVDTATTSASEGARMVFDALVQRGVVE